jgi:hypothetical protein
VPPKASSDGYHRARCCALQAEAFKQHQLDQYETVKGLLWTSWVPKSMEVFRRIPPVCINGDAVAYYKCVASGHRHTLLPCFVPHRYIERLPCRKSAHHGTVPMYHMCYGGLACLSASSRYESMRLVGECAT